MSDPLVEYVTDQAGDALQLAARYDPEHVTLLYCREDIDDAEARAIVTTLHERLTWEWQPSASGNDDLSEVLGETRASVHVRERCVTINIPSGDRRGVLMGLDLDAARNLTSFVAGCTRRLEDANVQPDGVPTSTNDGRDGERDRRTRPAGSRP